MKKERRGEEKGSVIGKLLLCVAGIYICYLSYGIVQEKIFKFEAKDGSKFQVTLFLLCLQCLVNAGVAFLAMFIWKPKKTSIPFTPFSLSAFTYLAAMLCSNEALKHVSYPTQALGKSCKMIPVMLMGVLIGGKKYSMKEYACVFLITIGIVIFQLGKLSESGKTGKENSTYGLVLLFVSLAMDGITGSKQEEITQSLQPSVHQQMLYTNLWAFIYTFVACALTGQGIEGILFCVSYPEIIEYLALFSIFSAFGQNFIFYTIQTFSALTCTTITTTRKFFTILASVVVFGNSLSQQSWIGVLIVFIGLGWELISKYSRHQNQSKAKSKKV